MSAPFSLLSVLIPVYNEESTIGEVVDQVEMLPLAKEIIVVDDGSTDRTLAVLRSRGAAIKHAHESRVNAGKGIAIRIGLTYVEGDLVIIQDADLELDPAEYVALLRPIVEGRADVVYGTRFAAPMARLPLRSMMANRLFTGLINLLYGTRLSDALTAYKLMRTAIIRDIRLTSRGFEFDVEVTAKLARLGHRIIEVPVSYRPRSKAEGKKIRWHHSFSMVMMILRCRVLRLQTIRASVSRSSAPNP